MTLSPIHRTLPNGVRLSVLDLPHTHTVSIWAIAPGGVIYESADTNGISHAVEHLHLSTTRRHRTRIELTREMDRVATFTNAIVDQDRIAFTMNSSPEYAADAIALLAECLELREFDAAVIEDELRLLSVELVTRPPFNSRPAIAETFARHPYGLPIGGNPRTVLKLKPDWIHEFARRALAPDQFSVGIAGAVTDEIVDAAERAFGALESKSADRLAAAAPPTLKCPRFFPVGRHSVSGVSITFGRCSPLPAADYNACWMIMLGLSMVSSPLREDLRYSLSASYNFEATSTHYGELFLFEVATTTRPRDRDGVAERITRELVSIGRAAADPGWFEPARRRALCTLQSALDDPPTLAYRIAWEQTHPGRPSIAADIGWMSEVRFDEVAAVARRIFRLENLCVCYSTRSRLFDASRFRNRILGAFA